MKTQDLRTMDLVVSDTCFFAKTSKIEFYRLRGLNQAKKLLTKATALSDQKRLVMAIVSGKASRLTICSALVFVKRRGLVPCWLRIWQPLKGITTRKVLQRRRT